MALLLTLPAIVSLLALAAHFVRENNPLLTFLILGVLCVMFVRRAWVARVVQGTLCLGGLVWLYTTWSIVQTRMFQHENWVRAAVILLSVGAFSLLAAMLFQLRPMKRFYATDVAKS